MSELGSLELLRKCQEAAARNEALTLTNSEQRIWSALCAEGLGVDVWSWRPQDRNWTNPDEPLRVATRKGMEMLK